MKDIVIFMGKEKTIPYIKVKVIYGLRNNTEKTELMSVASSCMTKEEIIPIAHKLILNTIYNNWIMVYENKIL
ncbi:MAG: hypothetical protein ACOH2V_00565 [Candidatus Saccharimonadaceae bacterium]